MASASVQRILRRNHRYALQPCGAGAEYRCVRIARRVKGSEEGWARQLGAEVLNTNVHVENAETLRINEKAAFRVLRLNIRKDLA